MAQPPHPRADELMVAQNLCPSRTQAQALIMAGSWGRTGAGSTTRASASPPGRSWRSESRRFASRAGFKLEGAPEDLGLDPAGLNCLDLGASTGGFTG
jgi:23S rRNA (cytidine1920-2'-O)/16S rRNA (cytidine1409-2'-O)-methyltransferase